MINSVMQTTESVSAINVGSSGAQLCHPLGRHHLCTKGAAKAALTGAASELETMTHSFTLGSQEILTMSPATFEPRVE